MKQLTVDEYFQMPESMRPMELVYGVVREPPAPRYGHQSVVTRLTCLLDRHVREHALGAVCVSPIDVVLDGPAALVVQPDIIFVSQPRLDIVGDRVWGPPDLVVEVLSPRTATRDRITKLGWYSRYGVRECWLVDPRGKSIEVHDLAAAPAPQTHLFDGESTVRSTVLGDLALRASQVFS